MRLIGPLVSVVFGGLVLLVVLEIWLVLARWALVILGRRVVPVLVVLVLVVLVVSLMGWHINRVWVWVLVLVLRVLVLRLLVPSCPVRLVVRIRWATVEILDLVGVGLILTLALVLILIPISPSKILVISPWCVPLLPRNPIPIRIAVPCCIGLFHIRPVIWLII